MRACVVSLYSVSSTCVCARMCVYGCACVHELCVWAHVYVSCVRMRVLGQTQFSNTLML